MTQMCRTCGARLDETTQPLPVTHCPWCGALLSADGETPTTHPAALDQPLAPQPQHQRHQRHQQSRPARWLRGAGGLGVLVLCVALLSLLLYALVHSGGFRIVVAPSASSNSNAAANSNASAKSNASSGAPGAPTATLPGGPGGQPPSTTRTPAASPSPARSPTATPIPPTLTVVPTTIQLTTCVAAQTTFTVSNTGGAPFSWIATASSLTYKLSPPSGTLGGGEQTVVTVSLIALSGTITMTAANARNSPQHVTITCPLV
jgi:hypothetical protein